MTYWVPKVMSDWYGVYSIDLAINAGLDLEMPGVRGLRQYNNIERVLVSYKSTVDDLKARVRQVLKLVQHVSKTNANVSSTQFASSIFDH
jgi:beta-glucosidase